MEKALKIMNGMKSRKIELGAIEDLRLAVKKVEAYKREIDGFITRYNEIKDELNQYENNRKELIREAENAVFKSGVPLNALQKQLADLGANPNDSREVKIWKETTMDVATAIQKLIQVGK
jgi:hypothetical protein